MPAIALLGCLVVAVSVTPSATADPAEILLGDDAELIALHQGYVSWMAAHPDVAAREDPWLGLMTLHGFREVAVPFDEALVESPEATRAQDAFYTHLADDPAARDQVERLARVVMQTPNALIAGQAALTWLQANPETARRFLQNPALVTPMPEILAPLKNADRAFPEWWTLFETAFRAVEEAPVSYERVFPWWQQAARLDDDHAAAYTNLALNFARFPDRFWVWHRRELALAEDAQARNWIRYWHRKLRRSDVDLPAYYAALRTLTPVVDDAVEWPPKTDPPALAAYTEKAAEGKKGYPKRPERPIVERPEMRQPKRPGVKYPARPDAPKRPTRPTVERPTPRVAE